MNASLPSVTRASRLAREVHPQLSIRREALEDQAARALALLAAALRGWAVTAPVHQVAARAGLVLQGLARPAVLARDLDHRVVVAVVLALVFLLLVRLHPVALTRAGWEPFLSRPSARMGAPGRADAAPRSAVLPRSSRLRAPAAAPRVRQGRSGVALGWTACAGRLRGRVGGPFEQGKEI